MTFNIFLKGFRLQMRIVVFFFVVGALLGMLAMRFGGDPKEINQLATRTQELSEPLKTNVEKTLTGKNSTSWVYFLFGNGFTNTLFFSLIFMVATFKSFHKVDVKPGFISQKLYQFTSFYLKIFKLDLNSSPTFLNLAAMLSFPNFVGFGFLAFSFGLFTVSAIKMTCLGFYFAAIIPHGIFEIPAAIASSSLPLALLIEIVRQKRENETVDTWPLSREIVFSKNTGIIIAAIFLLTLTAAVIEAHFTDVVFKFFYPSI